jgi:hypothetical protein
MVRRSKTLVVSRASVSPREAKAILFTGTLKPNTAHTYKNKIEDFRSFCEGQEMTEDRFYQYVHELSAVGVSAQSIATLRCALLHFQRLGLYRSPTGECWAEAPDVMKACRGVGVCHGFSPGRPRGAITSAMLEAAFTAHAAAGHPVSLRDQQYLWIIYEGALRREEFTTLRSHDLYSDGVNYFVKLHVDKRAKAGSKYTAIHKRLVTVKFAAMYHLVSHDLHPNAYILCEPPSPAMSRLNAILHSAATLCNWELELVFDGVHCLRHGHAADYRHDPTARERMSCTQVNTDWYARSNADRILGHSRALNTHQA